MKIRKKPLIISLLIAWGIEGLSALLTMNSMDVYRKLQSPPLAPPGWFFPVVWTILFTLMGISAYLIYVTESPERKKALTIYGIQLLLNLGWSLIFFNLGTYLFSFFWLIALWVFVLWLVISFYRIHKTAGYLQIPYLLWATFAAYLNFGIYLLN